MHALPQYFAHINKNPESIIARIYGVFKVQMEDIVPVNLLLMANTIKHNSVDWIQNVYDLKGSIINRQVKITPQIKKTSTLKDVNLQKIKQEMQSERVDYLKFRKEDIERINKMIELDTQLMSDFNLMDYSLLMAIEKVPRSVRKRQSLLSDKFDMIENSSNVYKSENVFRNSYDDDSSKLSAPGKRHKYISSCGKYIYHLAIIDYLQEFNFEKRGESRLKIWVLRRPPTLISAVDPVVYRKRFM